MQKVSLYIIMAVALLLVSGCIHNDLPYPKLPQYITSIAADGELSPAVIDNENFTVQVALDESTNPYEVRFSDFTITEGAESSPNLLEGTYDLSVPLKVTVSLYQDYVWTITATQQISRSVVIAGQIGASEIDPVGHRVIIKVPDTFDLKKLELLELKLGPAGVTTMSPAIEPGYIDLSQPLDINVSYFGYTWKWTLYVEKTTALVTTTAVDAWSQVIWAYGAAGEDTEVGFQYRQASSQEWITVDPKYITRDGGSFSCYIPHLTPLTEYVVRATSDEYIGNDITVKTQATEVLIDGSFDQWWLNGKVWCPWDQNGIQYWDTGNTGAATLGQSNVQPSDFTPTGEGQSAKLETKFVGLGGLGKLAAGSIYTGKFAKVDGTNGIVDFGRPFTIRPTKLRGYMHYTTAPINYASAEYSYLKDRPDSCHIYIALTDWTAPYQIRTNPKNRQVFDKNADYVIGYGELIRGSNTGEWKEFEIKLDYRSTSKIPTYIQITCAASKYGDFFTGGTGACLYVDQFSLEYDY